MGEGAAAEGAGFFFGVGVEIVFGELVLWFLGAYEK
jgi:hypothetical protein